MQSISYTLPINTQVIERNDELASKSRSIPFLSQAAPESASDLKDRQIEPKGMKQLLEDGVAILNQSIAERQPLAKKRDIIAVTLLVAGIAMIILGGLGGPAAAVAIILQMETLHFSLSSTLATGLLTGLGILGSTAALATFLLTRSEKINAQREAIKTCKEQIKFAKETQEKAALPEQLLLQGYAKDGQVNEAMKALKIEQNRKEQEGILLFCKIVAEQKLELEKMRNDKAATPLYKKIYRKLAQQIQPAVVKSRIVALRVNIAKAFQRLAVAVQP